MDFPPEVFVAIEGDPGEEYLIANMELEEVSDDSNGKPLARYVLKEVGTFTVKKSVRRQLKRDKRG
jgi:hypothetical protein